MRLGGRNAGKNPADIPFALLYLIDDDGKHARLEQTCGVPRDLEGLTPQSIQLAGETVKALHVATG